MTDQASSSTSPFKPDVVIRRGAVSIEISNTAIISVKSLCFSSIVISTDALAYIILGHEEKNTMTFLSD